MANSIKIDYYELGKELAELGQQEKFILILQGYLDRLNKCGYNETAKTALIESLLNNSKDFSENQKRLLGAMIGINNMEEE